MPHSPRVLPFVSFVLSLCLTLLMGAEAHSVAASPITCTQAALNAAIQASNTTYAPIELPTGCTITLDGTLNSGSVYDGPGPTALAPITGTVTIFTADGDTPATITRDSSAGAFRLFSVQGGMLTLANVIIDGGLAKGGNGGNGTDAGVRGSEGGGGGGGGMGGNGGTGTTISTGYGGGGGGGGSTGNGGDAVDTSGGDGGTGFDENGTNGSGGAAGHNGGGGGGGKGGTGGGSGGALNGGGKAGFGGGGGAHSTQQCNFACTQNAGFGGGHGGYSNSDDLFSGGGGGGGAGLGGAIFVYSGSLNTFSTTFSNNKTQGGKGGNGFADGSGGNGGSAYGGAIFNAGAYCDGGNTTFSLNTALGGNAGANGNDPTLGSPPDHGVPLTETSSDRFDNPGSNGLTAGTTSTDCTTPGIAAPDPLPHAAVGNAYSQTVTVSGGVPRYVLAITAGTLPNTLSFDGDTGVLSGTPTAQTSINFTVKVTDFFGQTGTKDYTLTIDEIAVSPPTLPVARLGQPYSQVISASGGIPPIILSTFDTPPPSLTFDPPTGVLSGIPTTLGDTPFTILATDDFGRTGSQAYVIHVHPPLSEDVSDHSDSDSSGSSGEASGALCSAPNGVNSFVRATVPDGAASLDGVSASVYCTALTVSDQYGGPFDQPVLHAVEVFALTGEQPSRSVTTFSAPVTICLQGSGRILFRDASSSGAQGRTVVELPSFAQGDFTCAQVPNAGTVILLDPPVDAPQAPVVETSSALATCTVTTTARLNLHATPELGGAVLDLVPYQASLKATARQGDFVQVVFGDHQGWLSAQYLTLDGDCGS